MTHRHEDASFLLSLRDKGVLRASKKDPLHEVIQMKQEISTQVQNWIHEQDLPSKATMKPIKKFDGLYPEDDEERQAYWDFIHWAINKEHAVLLYIPKTTNRKRFLAARPRRLRHRRISIQHRRLRKNAPSKLQQICIQNKENTSKK